MFSVFNILLILFSLTLYPLRYRPIHSLLKTPTYANTVPKSPTTTDAPSIPLFATVCDGPVCGVRASVSRCRELEIMSMYSRRNSITVPYQTSGSVTVPGVRGRKRDSK